MSTRSQFLVHWTGKNIAGQAGLLTDEHRRAYIERLKSILQDGFWMMKPPEQLHGRNGSWVKYLAPMTCFTEVRLSQARAHAERYGLLGVAVDRRFVLDRWGGPVHYVRNHPEECVIGNVQEINNYLRDEQCPDIDKRREIHAYFALNSAFLKAMSHKGVDDYEYLEENEWRIVHSHLQESSKKIVATGLDSPQYKIPLKPSDVRLIVFPDEETRTLAIQGKPMDGWFESSHAPPFLTLAECSQF